MEVTIGILAVVVLTGLLCGGIRAARTRFKFHSRRHGVGGMLEDFDEDAREIDKFSR